MKTGSSHRETYMEDFDLYVMVKEQTCYKEVPPTFLDLILADKKHSYMYVKCKKEMHRICKKPVKKIFQKI